MGSGDFNSNDYITKSKFYRDNIEIKGGTVKKPSF